jgi:nucleoside-diphosphate-sugar epimerase
VNASVSDKGVALVTGFPGWLGNRLVRFLHDPHPDFPQGLTQPSFERVRCLVLPGTPLEGIRSRYPDLEIVEGDIRDPAATARLCAGASEATAFHLAGIIHPRRVRDLYEINAEGTRNLLDAAAAAGVRRVVATSSNSPAGVARDPSVLFDESSPYRPYMNYGRSKMLMEQHLSAAHRAGALETVILRPCWFYGPDQPRRQSEFFHMIKSGRAPILGDGESRRSMSYVDNAVLGLLLAAGSERAAGETYWVADRRPYSMNDIVDTVENLLENEFGMQVAHDRMRLPSLASEVALVIDAAVQRMGLYHQRMHVLSEMNKTIACSIGKAQDQLGYRPRVELREGMRRSIEWCLQNGHEI